MAASARMCLRAYLCMSVCVCSVCVCVCMHMRACMKCYLCTENDNFDESLSYQSCFNLLDNIFEVCKL